MPAENAVYGGEMSAHHYFRDFAYCDSGMIPWLLMDELMSLQNASLSSLVKERVAAFPCSSEINYKVADVGKVLARIENTYAVEAKSIDRIDGVSMDMGDWRFNIRASNTEPLLRLNVESRANPNLVQRSIKAIEHMIEERS